MQDPLVTRAKMQGCPAIFVTVIVAVSTSVVKSECLDYDYAPCHCSYDITLKIACNNVSVDDVQQVFGRAPASEFDYWNSFEWYLSDLESNVALPADILANVTFKDIQIHCPSTSYRLRLDSDAFRSSASVAKQFYLFFCDLSEQQDYAFIDAFDQMFDFLILGAVNIPNFSKLPRYLPELYALELPDNTMVEDNSGASYTLNYPKLDMLWLSGSDFDDLTIGNLVNAVLPVSADTLRFLDLGNNRLTRMPDNVPHAFTHLDNIYVEGNHIRSLAAGSIDYSLAYAGENDPYAHFSLFLEAIELDCIEPGAFQGNCSHMYVDLSFNNLAAFQEDVYSEMLQTMSHRAPSSNVELNILNNPIDCEGCGLAWLIRDNRHLLDYVYGGTCSNGTKFEQLDPNGFDACNEPTTVPTDLPSTDPTTLPSTDPFTQSTTDSTTQSTADFTAISTTDPTVPPATDAAETILPITALLFVAFVLVRLN